MSVDTPPTQSVKMECKAGLAIRQSQFCTPIYEGKFLLNPPLSYSNQSGLALCQF